MAKSTGLAVFALLIAMGSLGLGAYQLFFVEESGIRNTWSDFYEGSVVTNPVDPTWVHVDQLLINFTVNPGESAFFLFSTVVTIQTTSFLQLKFTLDGVRLSDPLNPWWQAATSGTLMQAPITFHYMLDTISIGPHNLSIHITGNDVSNQISSSTLLVQTIIP